MGKKKGLDAKTPRPSEEWLRLETCAATRALGAFDGGLALQLGQTTSCLRLHVSGLLFHDFEDARVVALALEAANRSFKGLIWTDLNLNHQQADP